MRVLGIDPGTARMGFGVVQEQDGKFSLIETGCLESRAESTTSERLFSLYGQLRTLFETHRPDALAIEKLFFSRNVSSAMEVGQARGLALLIAAQEGLPVAEYTPNQIKEAVTGSGRAEKIQVQRMVQKLLVLSSIPKPDDAADALAVALCHLARAPLTASIALAEARR